MLAAAGLSRQGIKNRNNKQNCKDAGGNVVHDSSYLPETPTLGARWCQMVMDLPLYSTRGPRNRAERHLLSYWRGEETDGILYVILCNKKRLVYRGNDNRTIVYSSSWLGVISRVLLIFAVRIHSTYNPHAPPK